MPDQQVHHVLAKSETIKELFYDIYHHFEKNFDYSKLKAGDKLLEDAVRTAFFSGFHEAEKHYKLQSILDLINNSPPKESVE